MGMSDYTMDAEEAFWDSILEATKESATFADFIGLTDKLYANSSIYLEDDELYEGIIDAWKQSI